MHVLLSTVGRSFLRAFGGSVIVLGIGVLSAPSLRQSYLLGVAALLASIAAGIKAVQVYIPQFSLAAYLGKPYGEWVDSFLRAFLASLCITLPGLLNAPDLGTGRSLGTAAIVGAFTAGLRALQGLFTVGEHPAPATGIAAPPVPPTP